MKRESTMQNTYLLYHLISSLLRFVTCYLMPFIAPRGTHQILAFPLVLRPDVKHPVVADATPATAFL